MSALPQLPLDRLSLVVFGPGYGESVAVCAPPGRWLVIDSLVDSQGMNPATELLGAHRAEPDAVLLTHPHGDHAAGFDEFVRQWPSAKVGFLAGDMSLEGDRLSDSDAARALREGTTEHTVAAICDAWELNAARQWHVTPGTELSLGEATVSVLGPDERTLKRAGEGKRVDPNAMSTPLAIEWRNTRLVLGADVPAVGWSRIEKERAEARPGDHQALKIPHHGSKAAQHRLLCEPQDGRERFWALTPWQLAGGTLPRFEDKEGLDLLLQRVPKIAMTALPHETMLSPAIRQARRRAIVQQARRSRFSDSITLVYDRPKASAGDAWVCVSYADDGSLDSQSDGPAAITILP